MHPVKYLPGLGIAVSQSHMGVKVKCQKRTPEVVSIVTVPKLMH